MTTADFITELSWRGLLAQCTNEDALRKHLQAATRRAYVGFDPTADSLTIGNLVPIMLLAHFQRAGHAPVVVAGGGTGLIGDPSGKSAERQLLDRARVQANVNAQKRIYEKALDFTGAPGDRRATLVDNADWLCKLGYVEALRDIGKHFSVNMMIQKESVKERLHNRDQGISYTEFSYMILQAYDFLHLYREQGVTLQMGGSDQWGNIVAGADLIRRVCGADDSRSQDPGPQDSGPSLAFGLTAPLVTKSDGGKFGKTESGAIWLTADRTSPYAFYQFWLNSADADVIRFLKIFTFLPREQIEALEQAHAKDPGQREPHRALARDVTTRMHGPTEAQHAEAAAKALFSGEIAHLPEATLRDIFADVPSSQHSKAQLSGEGVGLMDLLVETKLAQSKREAKEFLAGGSVTINGRKAAPDDRLKAQDLLHGSLIALRRGKKHWHLTRWA
jgi:tyrosyl-tRNA synthetase